MWVYPVPMVAVTGILAWTSIQLPRNLVPAGLQGDVCSHMIARHLAAEFNVALTRCGITQLSYEGVSILLLPDPSAPSGKKVLFMEPYLEGR